jgi:translocating chain-associated membrane protein 1
MKTICIFQIKREDMGARIQYASLYLLFIVGAYVFSLTRLGLCLMILQYVAEAVFHLCRLLSYTDKQDIARPLYKVHDILFVLARLGSISLAVLTFYFGLPQADADKQVIDISTGNYNTSIFRMAALAAVCILQVWLMWNFITFHLRRMRENRATERSFGVQTR